MYPTFVFIRHGQSAHNQKVKQLSKKYTSYLSSNKNQSVKEMPQYKQIKYDAKLIDEGLTDQGRKQAIKVKQALNMDHIDIVVVSPLRRALETCNIIFQNSKNIKIIVQPLLSQILSSAIDIGGNIIQSIQLFGHKFDFTKITQKQAQRWYLDEILSLQNKQAILQFEKTNKTSTALATLQLMKNKVLQTNSQLQARVMKLKKQLAKYKIQSKKKVAIVGHGGVLRFITATGFFQDGQAINCANFQNGEVKQIPIIIQGYQFQDEDLVPFCKIK